MKHGMLLNKSGYGGFKPNYEKMIKAGYRQTTNHFEAKKRFDEQWISNTDSFGQSRFPRFHLVKLGKKWFIHYDYYVVGEERHHTITSKSPELRAEIQRLCRV